MISLTESFNHMKHTPLYKIEQNEREIIQRDYFYIYLQSDQYCSCVIINKGETPCKVLARLNSNFFIFVAIVLQTSPFQLPFNFASSLCGKQLVQLIVVYSKELHHSKTAYPLKRNFQVEIFLTDHRFRQLLTSFIFGPKKSFCRTKCAGGYYFCSTPL